MVIIHEKLACRYRLELPNGAGLELIVQVATQLARAAKEHDDALEFSCERSKKDPLGCLKIKLTRNHNTVNLRVRLESTQIFGGQNVVSVPLICGLVEVWT